MQPRPSESSQEVARLQLYAVQLDHLLAHTAPDVLASPGMQLVCDTQEEARYFRVLLDRRQLVHVEVRVKALLPAPGHRRRARHQAGYKTRR